MIEPANAYVFVSADRTTIAITLAADGANLPATMQWVPRKIVALVSSALSAHVPNSLTVMTDLSLRGYHLSDPSPEIVHFPQAHRHSS